MKNLVIMILLGAALTGKAQSHFVDKTSALDIAAKEFALSRNFDSKSFNQLKPELKFTGVQNDTVTYYVVGFKGQAGLVFLSACELTLPVIGVTNESKFDINNIPDGLRWLLGKHQERIIHMLRSEARNPGSMPKEEEWKKISEYYGHEGERSKERYIYYDTIGPLVTAKWHQSWPYNLHCPRMNYVLTTCKTIAGCGPIAMAQVMHYNKFPDRYDWSQMPDQLTSENHEVARLVLDAGKAAKTGHGCSFSATWPSDIDDALKNIFGYPYARYDDDIDDDGRHENFILKIRDQISQGFPVIVDGYEEWNMPDWHLFVLDGFLGPPNRIGRFHINWGWGGSHDGWYRLDICNPPGSAGPYNYNQGVIHQIIPWGRIDMVFPESLSTVYSYNDVFIGWQSMGRPADFDSALIQLYMPKYKSKDTLDPDNIVTLRVANQPGNNFIVYQFDTPKIPYRDSLGIDARITVFRTVSGNHTQKYHSDYHRFYLRDGEAVNFDNPDAGTIWQANMPATINWTYNTNVHSNKIPEFKIKFSKVSGPGGNWGMIASNVQGSSVDWLIPPGLEGVYRIEGHYSGDTEKWFQSEQFTITQHPILSITIPAVAGHYEPGKNLNITWQSNLSENVRIKLSRFDDVNAADTIIIAESAPNTGSFIWPIPEDINPGTLYALEITGVVNTHIYAAIAFFTIRKKLSLIHPQGGVEWENGKTHYITWLDQYPGNVRISLYKGGVFHSNIVLNTENDGVYAWSVPSSLAPSPAYQIRISKVDDDSVFSLSEYFSIVEAYFIDVIKPEPNIHWQKGEGYYIKWDENVPNAFIIELLDYSVWPPAETLINNYTFQGYFGYLWTVPNTLDAHGLYKIRVTSFQFPEVSGISEYFNIINGPEINVQVPNDTTSWPTASSQQILYSDNLNGTVSIHLYNRSASPGFITTLANNVPSTGSFTWNIPPLYTPGDDYYIIVRSDDFPTVQSVSDDFELTQGPYIQLTSPELGDEWEVGTTQTITWNTSVTAPKSRVVIFLVRPAAGFSLKIHNTTSVNNSGAYNWTIPTDLPPATNYRIDIQIWNAPNINDRSKIFSITNQAGNYLSVTSPSQGEAWKIGTIQTVSWDHNYTDNWFSWRFYKGDIPTSSHGNVIGSSVPVAVPASLEPGDDYRIKISRFHYPETYDFSEEFEILPADFIHYTGPLVMRMNDTVLLTWNDNIDDHVAIELMHADTVFHTIAPSVESNGNYLWVIPTHFPIEQWFKIRISSVNDPTLFALSNNVQIKFPHFVSLFAPSASILSLGGSHLIEWTHNFPGGYSGEHFSIDLYKDDEYITWITPGALMNVHHWIPTSFNVPEPGDYYSIKISSTSKPHVFDFSEYFTIIDCDSIPPFSLGQDTVLYLDSEIVIFAPDGYQNYVWEPYYFNNQSRFLEISGHGLNGPGVLEIICHATYAGGCFKSDTILINVLYPPCHASASFTYLQSKGSDMCNSFLFMCLEDITMTHNVEWDFGDGTIVDTTAMIVEHEYANSGSYLVKCKVYHPQFTQCFEEYSETVHVNIPPEISLLHWVSVDTAWVVPIIQGSGEYRVNWYIDDKLVETMKLDTVYNDTLMYIFPKNDTYPVSAHVFDSLSPHCSFVGSTSIAINDIPPCRSTTGYFSYRPLDGYGSGVRNKFQFWAGVNINLDCYEITWNMGDGKPKFTDSLDFTYKFNPGTYVVTMTLQNCDTCIFILTDTINAFLPLDAGLPDLVEACDSTILYANPDLAAWEWSDSTYNSWLPVYQSGEYRVLVVDGYGYYIYDTAQVFIHPSPEVGFDEIPIICSDESFIIFTQGTPSGGTYSGNFVEGNIFNVADAGPGFHEISYHFEDIHGCASVAHAIIEVEPTHSGNLYLQNHVVSGNFYLTGDSIVSGSHITDLQSYGPWVVETGADVYLKADKSIILKPGTVIKSGSQLRAIILPLNCLEFVKKDLHTKTEDFENPTKVFLAPNPTNGQTYIWTESGTLEGFTLEVFDSKGITLIKTNDLHSSKTIINLSAYPPGLYFVRLIDGKSVHSIKLIRN